EDHLVHAGDIGVADVHAWALAHGLEPLQMGDRALVVGRGGGGFFSHVHERVACSRALGSTLDRAAICSFETAVDGRLQPLLAADWRALRTPRNIAPKP